VKKVYKMGIPKSFIRKVIEEGKHQSQWNKRYAAMRLGLKPTPENCESVIFVSRRRRTKMMGALRKKAHGRLLDKYYEYPAWSSPRYQYFFFRDELENLMNERKKE